MFTYYQELKFFWNLSRSSSQNFAVTTYNHINSGAKKIYIREEWNRHIPIQIQNYRS